MTQKELIEFCKENDPNYNKDASFKENLEPMWSIPKGIGGIGITESEFKNGFYISINTKGRKGFEDLEGRVFYFKMSIPMEHSKNTYNSHWKKFFIPLDDLYGWGNEITSQIYDKCVTETDLVVDLCMASHIENGGKGILEQIEPPIKYEPMTPEELETQKTLYDSVQSLKDSAPEIIKESVETMFRLNHTWLKFRKREKPTEKVDFTIFDGEEPFLFQVTSQQFSDLVDLMIEARKDLLK
jgi:hypothetical protein